MSLWALVALIAFGIVMIFIRIPNGPPIYSVLGLLIFAGPDHGRFQRLRRSTDLDSAPLLAKQNVTVHAKARCRLPQRSCPAWSAVLQGPDAHRRDMHHVDRRRGVTDLGVPAGRLRRCEAVGQDDEVTANRHVVRVGVKVRVVKEDLD